VGGREGGGAERVDAARRFWLGPPCSASVQLFVLCCSRALVHDAQRSPMMAAQEAWVMLREEGRDLTIILCGNFHNLTVELK